MKTIYISHFPGEIKEGGSARNFAFYSYFRQKEHIRIFNIFRTNKLLRLYTTMCLTLLLYFVSGHRIFIHQGTLLYLYPKLILKYSIGRRFYKSILTHIVKKNMLILEINDLPYEQAIDLELPVYIEYLYFENIIFSIKKINFIFAANEMCEYASSKYNINIKKTKVIINGASSLTVTSGVNVSINKDKINFVYAGTLNKGRQIEKLITLFRELNNKNLILLGANGEWINSLNLPPNILYLGNYNESVAHWMVSQCDVGIIPYDSSKLYYNICFPTKVSFYLTANIPVLSTPLSELMQYHKEFIFFSEWDNWSDFVDSIKREDILYKKEFIKNNNFKYEWENLLKKELDE